MSDNAKRVLGGVLIGIGLVMLVLQVMFDRAMIAWLGV